jgi:hypothetical protein
MDRQQTTELVAEKRRVAPPPPAGVLNRPLPRWILFPLLLLLAYAGLLMLMNFSTLHIYQKYFGETLPRTSVPWQALSSALDESALRAQFPAVPLRCMADDSHIGDRVCYAAVRDVDGFPALTLALFLQKGRLTLATVHVPWWGHGRAAEQLARNLGTSELASGGPGTMLRRWTVPSGFVDMNARRSWNVLDWSAIVWTPGRAN